jgi:hypothetical protein
MLSSRIWREVRVFGPSAPQQNGENERKFQTFFGKIRAMLKTAGLKDLLRSGVWAECAMPVTHLSNTTSIKEKMICPYQLLFGSKPRLPESLRSFGENWCCHDQE